MKTTKIYVLPAAIMIMLFAFDKGEAEVCPYEFAKFVLQWPPSFCNTGDYDCIMSVPVIPDKSCHFIVSGFSPMYPPYETNKRCTTERYPTPTRFVTRATLHPELEWLDDYWPYIGSPDETISTFRNGKPWYLRNELNWKGYWYLQGKCYKYPTRPLIFFGKAGELRNRYGPSILDKLIQEDFYPYPRVERLASAYAALVNETVGKRPQIRCNKDSEKSLQLLEVALCFNTTDEIIDCREEFIVCDKDDMIKLPVSLIVD